MFKKKQSNELTGCVKNSDFRGVQENLAKGPSVDTIIDALDHLGKSKNQDAVIREVLFSKLKQYNKNSGGVLNVDQTEKLLYYSSLHNRFGLGKQKYVNRIVKLSKAKWVDIYTYSARYEPGILDAVDEQFSNKINGETAYEILQDAIDDGLQTPDMSRRGVYKCLEYCFEDGVSIDDSYLSTLYHYLFVHTNTFNIDSNKKTMVTHQKLTSRIMEQPNYHSAINDELHNGIETLNKKQQIQYIKSMSNSQVKRWCNNVDTILEFTGNFIHYNEEVRLQDEALACAIRMYPKFQQSVRNCGVNNHYLYDCDYNETLQALLDTGPTNIEEWVSPEEQASFVNSAVIYESGGAIEVALNYNFDRPDGFNKEKARDLVDMSEKRFNGAMAASKI